MQVRYEKIIVNEKTFHSPDIIAAGGTKNIIDIGEGEVMAIVNADLPFLRRFTDAEVAMSNRLGRLGLRVLPCTKAIAEINGCVNVPVLIMPSFAHMATQGKQIRDFKNGDSSQGDSTVFGSMKNLQAIEHWRKVFKHINDEMVIYLFNHIALGSDSFNLLIEDTERSSEMKKQTSSTLFSDLEQEIHLFFFDFNDRDRFYKETTYRFIDKNGSVSKNKIKNEAEYLFDKIINIIFCCMNPSEYEAIMKKEFNAGAVSELIDMSKAVCDRFKKEFASHIVTQLKAKLESLPSKDKLAQWKEWKEAKKQQKVKRMEFYALLNQHVNKKKSVEPEPQHKCSIM